MITSNYRLPLIFILLLLSMQGAVLALFGQPFICTCGYVKLWEGAILSPGNSQHLSDWYTFSHIIHGFIFYFLLHISFPKMSFAKRLMIAVGIECTWEILENTPMVIEHYRLQALASGYSGDSIINSLSDTLSMIAGFCFARFSPWWITCLIGIGLEIWVAYEVHDNLTLNILNLIYVFPAVKAWQSVI